MQTAFKSIVGALSAAAVAGFIGFSNAEAADGKTLYEEKGCAACHGEDAKTPLQPGYPKLVRQNADYTLNQMKDIKSGARANGATEMMKPILEDISEADMRLIADYVAGLK